MYTPEDIADPTPPAQSERATVPLCPACGYHLAGVRTTRCPECGRPFSPHDAHTAPPDAWGAMVGWPGWCMCAALLAAAEGWDWLKHPPAGVWLTLIMRTEHAVPPIPTAAAALLLTWALLPRRRVTQRRALLKLAWGLTALTVAGVVAMSL